MEKSNQTKQTPLLTQSPPPTVFHDLVKPGSSFGKWELRYAGTLRQAFDPAAIRISHRTGRLYHLLDQGKKKGKGAGPAFGLLRSHVGLLLMDRIHYDGEAPLIEWSESRIPIPPLPTEEEPLWGLPPTPHDLSG